MRPTLVPLHIRLCSALYFFMVQVYLYGLYRCIVCMIWVGVKYTKPGSIQKSPSILVWYRCNSSSISTRYVVLALGSCMNLFFFITAVVWLAAVYWLKKAKSVDLCVDAELLADSVCSSHYTGISRPSTSSATSADWTGRKQTKKNRAWNQPGESDMEWSRWLLMKRCHSGGTAGHNRVKMTRQEC